MVNFFFFLHRGGDITFVDGGPLNETTGIRGNTDGHMGWVHVDYSVGNREGKGVSATGWRVTLYYLLLI